MNLYEVTNGYIGESHIRVYAWCQTEIDAESLARTQFIAENQRRSDKYESSYWENLKVRFLFSSDSTEFATKVSDEGFRMS